MNVRIAEDKTPEGQLAGVARTLMLKMEEQHRQTNVGPREPDYADFREAFRPYLRRMEVLVRIDEARKTASAAMTARVKELAEELLKCENEIPDEDRDYL